MYEIGERIARFALEAKLPSVSGWSSFANKGLGGIPSPSLNGDSNKDEHEHEIA
jgi:hypothetical protein